MTRAERVGVALAVVLLLASLTVTVHPWYDRSNDGSIYVATARSLVAGDGYTYLGIPFLPRPPGFAVLLAPLVAAFGTSFPAFNLFVSLFGLAGVVLLYALQRRALGPVLAGLVALALWLNPDYQRLCNQVMSDVPGATLMLACLGVERWCARRPSVGREVALGACIAAAAYVRTVNVLLVPAIAAARLLARRPAPGPEAPRGLGPRRVVLFAAVAAAALAPWSVRNRLDPPPAPSEQTMLHSFGTAMWHRDIGDPASERLAPGEVLARVPVRVRQIAGALGGRLDGRELDPLRWALAGLFVAALLRELVARRTPEAWFALATLACLCVFPIGALPRYLLPVYALALPATVALVRAAAGPRLGEPLAAGLLVALVAADLDPRRDWERIEARHRELEALAQRVEERVGRDAPLAAPLGFHYQVYLDRPVYNLEHAVRREHGVDAAERIVAENGVVAVLLPAEPAGPLEEKLVRHFTRSRADVERLGSVVLVRVGRRP